jgi:hypothetical protein
LPHDRQDEELRRRIATRPNLRGELVPRTSDAPVDAAASATANAAANANATDDATADPTGS